MADPTNMSISVPAFFAHSAIPLRTVAASGARGLMRAATRRTPGSCWRTGPGSRHDPPGPQKPARPLSASRTSRTGGRDVASRVTGGPTRAEPGGAPDTGRNPC